MTDKEYNDGTAFASCAAATSFTVKGTSGQLTSANSVVNAMCK